MKKNKWILPVIILVAAAVAVVIFVNSQKKPPSFTTVKAEKGKISQTVVTTGTLQPVISVNVGAQVSGKIETLYVDYNSPVKTGQLLAKIDPSLFEAQLEESRASYDSSIASEQNMSAQYQTALMNVKKAQASTKTALAQQEIARANVISAEDALVSAKADLAKAKATLENRKLEYDRAEKLYKDNFISASERDSAEMNYKVSLADLDSASAALKRSESSVTAAKLQLDSSIYDVDAAKIAEDTAKSQAESSLNQFKSAQAQVRQSKSRLEQAEVNLGYTMIYSPIDGIVTSRSVDEGQTVASSFNTPELFVIAKDLKNMEVIANVDEADIGKVKKDLPASFTVDAFPNETFKGVVKQVRTAATVESGVVTYQAVISADNPSLKLLPGMTANITIIAKVSEENIKIPNAALRFNPETVPNFPRPPKKKLDRPSADKADKIKTNVKKDKEGKVDKETVWILTEGDIPKPVRVTVGISGGNFTEMLKGDIKEGDRIITGVQSLSKQKKTKGGMGKRPGRPMRV